MRNRSVVEILVLMFSFVVAFAIMGLGVLIIVVESRTPEADTAILATSLVSFVSGILGALLGLIAGRSDSTDQLHHRPGGDDDGLDE